MKRRNFCRYTVLSSASFAGVLGQDFVSAISSKSSPVKSVYEWVVLYWMPYDNDLSRFGEPIVEMLNRGMQNSANSVVIQSDYYGESKMRRRQIIDGNIHEIDVTGEDSSDILNFSTYLDWAEQTFEAKHWVIIVVGHGGKINEISPDDHGKSIENRTWMRVDQFTNAVSKFNQSTGGKVELLFFQNCNKATLEVVYEARNCARYTLASQMILGAPNYYYEGFLNYLSKPSLGGFEAAMAIINSERSDMYNTLTLVDNQAVELIPEKLSRVLQPFLDIQLPIVKQSLPSYEYSDEQHCDVMVLLNYISKISGQAENELTEFGEFLSSSVIKYYKTEGELSFRHGWRNPDMEKKCGLSIYIPKTPSTVSRYNALALYKKVDLVKFYRKIV